MFLLSKLDDGVSHRFPDDVDNTREFLLDRGIPAGSLEALTYFSARLAIDPSFRRDLTSLVQVVIRRENEAVDYMDLLGILVVAIAGAGPFEANDQQEESVREILRFLTQIRRPTGPVVPVFVGSQNVIPPALVAEPLIGESAPLPVRRSPDLASRRVSPVPFSQVEESTPSRRRGVAIAIAGVIALAVALGSGWKFYQNTRATSPSTEALASASPPSAPVTEKDELTGSPAGRVLESPARSVGKPSPVAARHPNSLRTPAATSLTEQAAATRPPQAPDTIRSSPAKPAVVAESVTATKPLSTLAENAPESSAPVGPASMSAPGVRRRLPKSVVINPAPPRRSGGSPENVNTSAPGVVHPASIGMMASRLISSPAPAYPAAASQARVQGEVRVRAVVDREGNVIDARVVSGPELLRDVSLEAVQHWRYRPYMQGGKPVEVATTAVLDFELP